MAPKGECSNAQMLELNRYGISIQKVVDSFDYKKKMSYNLNRACKAVMMWDIITEFCKQVILDYNAKINPKGD
jgi:hypothetical protein